MMAKNYTFEEAIKRLCDNGLYNFEENNILRLYPQCAEYIRRLGKDRIKALGYKEARLKKEVQNNNNMFKVYGKLEAMQDKLVGKTLKTSLVKELMQRVYDLCGIEKKAKATDINNYYRTKEHVKRINDKTTKVITIYECKYKSDIQ